MRFETAMNARIACVVARVVAKPAVMVDGVVERLRTIGGVVAEPAHIERDVLRQEPGIRALRGSGTILAHGSFDAVVIFHRRIGQCTGP
ncbi:MAG TPA: hypothetical protein VG672_14945, partial [Bryobacteraceae bacterium]|nr:hypothetical protein [Bryobacteraceae bacterium]